MSFSSFSKTEISTLFKKASMRVRSGGLKILTAPASGVYARMLMVASAKTGTAPERNLFKRRLRALFREGEFYEKGIDFIIIADKSGVNLSFESLKELFYKAFDRHNSAA